MDFEQILEQKIKAIEENRCGSDFLEGMVYAYRDCLNVMRLLGIFGRTGKDRP